MNQFLDQLPDYPINALRSDFFAALAKDVLLLEAEPGAGKSTLTPLWVLSALKSHQKVLLVQPRVLAAQSLAQRLADLVEQPLGQRVGYQVPYDNCSSAQTQLLVMTPGILLQHLLRDPTLEGIACVILDEIHERSVNQDTAWAWLQEARILRDDLQLILMSATPDPQLQHSVSNRLFAQGRCFPVTTQFFPAKTAQGVTEKLEDQVLRALNSVAQLQTQTCLIFLPGWSEIERCAQYILQNYPAQAIFRLHSRVPYSEQKRALDPASGPRIILSTNIAETSLTIADVTLVIDSGLVRRAEYEQRTGLTRLRVARISQASADQRRGRAGRVQAGHCIRLWSQDQPLAAADLPEIRATDYLPLALRLAHWGSPFDSLPWLEKPNPLAMNFAQTQLQKMQLLDANNKITVDGEKVSELGTHPRIAAFLLNHKKDIAESSLMFALALHFDLQASADIREFLEQAKQELKKNMVWRQQQKRWLQKLSLSVSADSKLNVQLLAQAFSDRIGFKQESGRYRLNSGISVQPLAAVNTDWALFPVVQPIAKGHTGLGLELSLTSDQQRALSQCETQFIFKQQKWQYFHQWRMGGVVIDEQYSLVDEKSIAQELAKHIHQLATEKGLMHLNWSKPAERLLQRARLAQQESLVDMPNLAEDFLVNNLSHWLLGFLNAQTQIEHLPWQAALEFYIGYDACQQLSKLLPEKISLPSGRDVHIEFSAEGVPQVSAKLQEFFGCEQLQLANGKLPLKIHLLSPNGSPLAITMNLQTFWQQAYPEVRKEMRGKYPRHPWPDNPLEHEATALTKRKLALQQEK